MKRNHLVVLCIFLLSMVLAQSSSDFSAVGERVTLKGHTSDVMSVAFSPDGRTLATGSADKTARLWNVSSGQEIMKFTGHTSLVTSVAFSPDGRTLATGSWDKTALIYGTPDFKPVFKVDDKLGELNITAPSGSSIRINDQTGSISQRLAPGRYTVTVTQDGYKTFTQIVTVTIGQTTQVTATLELLPSQLTILVTTPNARVTVNGRLVALDNNRATITINGETKVEVTASGFATQSQTITLKPGESRSFSFALEPLKTVIVVDVNVLNATVSINGQNVALAGGVASLTVSGSSASVSISAPGFTSINRTLNFTPGDAQNLKIELQPSSNSSSAPVAPVVNTAPVSSTAAISTKPRDDVFALVIGINDYQNSGIPDLKTAELDAKRFAAALSNPKIGNLNSSNIKVLLGADAGKNNLDGEYSDSLERLQATQTLIVYYAGHGAPTPDGKALLLPWDANPSASRLERSSIGLSAWTEQAKGKRVLFILDSCFSGQQGTRSLTADATRPVGVQIVPAVITGGVAVLSATSQNQSSQENSNGGLFTTAILEGLGGKADTNSDGTVSLEEAAVYTQRVVGTQTRNAQMPNLAGSSLNTFAVAQNAEVLAQNSVDTRLAKLDVLYKAKKLTDAQYSALSKMVEARAEPEALQRYLSGALSEDDFLRLVRRGLVVGVPAGTP